MKKLKLSLLFSTTLIIQNNILISKNIDYPLYRTTFSPISCSNLNAAENTGETITLGQSNNNIINFTSDANDIIIQANTGNLNLKTKHQLNINTTEEIGIIGKNIIYSTGNNNILMIDGNGKLFTSNNTSPITVGNLTAATTLLGNTTCGLLQPNSITTSGSIACGNLTAGSNSGDIIFLGNANGSINLYGSSINTPASNNYNILIIDSNNKISTSTNTTPIKCGNLVAGDTNCNNLTTININGTGITNCNTFLSKNTTCGNFSAAKDPGQNISLGNSSGSININGSNIKNPTTNNFNVLLIDSNGNISTSNTSSYLNCDNLTSNTINANNINTTSNINCNQINASTSIFGNLTAAKDPGQGILIGNNSGSIQINSNKITTPSANNSNILSIDSNNTIQTLPSTANISCNTITSNSTNTQTLNATTSTLGSLIAAKNSGETLTLGNSTGAFKISGTGITNPSTGANSLLMIDSSGQLATNTSSTAITCGAITGTSLATTGTLNAGTSTLGNTTTSNLNAATSTLGTLTAAGTAGQTVLIGNNTATGNYISFTNNTGHINIQSNTTGGNINLNTATGVGYINMIGAGLTPTGNTIGNTCLAIDRTGNIMTANAANIFKIGSDATGNNVIAIDNATTTNGITIASKALSLDSGTGSIKISGSGITNPTTGANSLLMIDSTGKLATNTSTTAINCGAITGTSLLTTGTLNAGASTLGALTTTSLNTTGNLNAGTSTLGSITAAGTPGQTVTLGNSTGAFKISGTGITNPATGANSLLMIDSTGQLATNTSSTAINCGAIAGSSLSTTGNLNAGTSTLGNTTTGTLNAATSTLGTLTAAGTAGQTVTLGNSTGAFKVSGTGITNPATGANSLLMIDSTGQLATNTSSTAITCGAITGSSLSTTGTLNAGTSTLGSITAAGTAGQTVTLGNSTGAFKVSGIGITNPPTGANSLLIIDSTGQLATNTSSTAITCGAITGNSLSTTGNLNAGTSTLGNTTTGTLNATTSTLGTLTAAGTAGQTVTLGNSTGAFKVSGTGITNPAAGANSLLMIDSTGQLATNTSSTAITCGDITGSSLSTTGNLNAGTSTLGSITAAGTAGQTVLIGNNTATGNYISFTNNTGHINIQSNTTGGNINLNTATGVGYINMIGAGLTPTGNTTGNTCLAIDRTGNIMTANAANIFKIGSDATGNNVIAIDNTTPANGITITSKALSLDSGTGSIKISGNGITNPTAGANSLLIIDSNGKLATNTSSTAITCGAITGSSLSTTGTLNAGTSTLGALTTTSLNTTGNLNAGTSTLGTLTAAGTAGQTVTLGNSTGAFKISGTGITNPPAGANSLLMIDSTGQLATNTSNTAITCGNLIAGNNTGQTITIGKSGGNIISFQNDSGNLLIQTNVNATGNQGLANVNMIFQSNNSIQLNTGGGVFITGPNTNKAGTLLIDASGLIYSNPSSRKFKKNIKNIELDNNIFDLIQPVSFNYIDPKKNSLYYGFIAEDIINIPLIKEAVIFEKDGITPANIDYISIFVLLTADYLNTKKRLNGELKTKDIIITELQNKIEALKNQITDQNNIINTLITAYTINNINLKELNERCKLLENTIGEIINKINNL